MASDKIGTCTHLALIGGGNGQLLCCAITADGHHWHYDRVEDITWKRGTPEECQASLSCQLPADCPNGPEPHPFIPPLPDIDLPCCWQPWEGCQPLTVAAVDPAFAEAVGEIADAAQDVVTKAEVDRCGWSEDPYHRCRVCYDYAAGREREHPLTAAQEASDA